MAIASEESVVLFPDARARADVAARFLPALLFLFAASGSAALIYEIVWYQLLQFAVGSTAVSLGVLLATFMGGLCIGSLALPRLNTQLHPLRLYALIELLIGAFALLELFLIPIIGGAYLTGPQSGFAGMLLRALVAAVCLLPPTVLMGATLPAMSRWIKSTPRGASWWSLLYGANTIGAVSGSLLAGYYLLRLYDVNIATYAAATLNLFLAATAARIAARTPSRLYLADEIPERLKTIAPRSTAHWSVYISIALSGACALGAEVVWTRLMGLMLGATVYAFSIILAVFLAGLALGTIGVAGLARRIDARHALGWCQLFAAAGIAWTAYQIADTLPFWPINPQLSKSAVFTFQIDLARTIWALLPATLFWGASFPFAFAATVTPEKDSAKTVAAIYAANTAGAIVGALAVSLILIPAIGTRDTQRVLLALSGASGLVALMPLMVRMRSQALELSTGIAAGLLALAVWSMDKVPDELIAFGRRIMITTGKADILYTAEGRNTSIAISRWTDGEYQFHVAGKVEASTEPFDMKLQRMLGHLPGLIHRDPKSVLVVGFGGGITAGTFTTYPNMRRIVICELEPLIPPVSTRYFAKQNYNVMTDKRTELVFDDARHFVASTPEKFDIITSDPIHPFVKGSATLYSKEYFEMIKAHLNPGGVVSQWVPLYESDTATVKSEIATFFEVFPYGTLWANTIDGQGYDIVLLGQVEPPAFDLDAIETRLARKDYARVLQSLRDVKFDSVATLFATYAGNAAELQPWLKDAAINHDRDLRLQYLAGLALNHAEEDTIYREIMQSWAPPVELLRGSPQRLDALFTAMATKDGGSPPPASEAKTPAP